MSIRPTPELERIEPGAQKTDKSDDTGQSWSDFAREQPERAARIGAIIADARAASEVLSDNRDY